MEQFQLTKELYENISAIKYYDCACYRGPDRGYKAHKIQRAYALFVSSFCRFHNYGPSYLIGKGCSGVSLAACTAFLHPDQFMYGSSEHRSELKCKQIIIVDDHINQAKTLARILKDRDNLGQTHPSSCIKHIISISNDYGDEFNSIPIIDIFSAIQKYESDNNL